MEQSIRVSLFGENGYVGIEVRDTGIGISKDKQGDFSGGLNRSMKTKVNQARVSASLL